MFFPYPDPSFLEQIHHYFRTKVTLNDVVVLGLVYASETGTSEKFCSHLLDVLAEFSLKVCFGRLKVFKYNLSCFGTHENQRKENQKNTFDQPFLDGYSNLFYHDILVFCISTWVDGSIPSRGLNFIKYLQQEELSNFSNICNRIAQVMGFCVLGFGNSEYEFFCTSGKDVYNRLKNCGAHFLLPFYTIDEAGTLRTSLEDWKKRLLKRLSDILVYKKSRNDIDWDSTKKNELWSRSSNLQGNTDLPHAKHYTWGIENDSTRTSDSDSSSLNKSSVYQSADTRKQNSVCFSEKGDLEDLAKSENLDNQPMLSDMQRQQLTKEGYKLVGSHSAVKLCRWTKSQLRGRGGCYKHTFYGIESYLCMEATPSLACANKCVFCWRHHKNPVGKTWKWEMDDPQVILNGIIKEHHKMIKQLKGVAGVKQERFLSAMTTIKHCALSLVGEPIMYPKIRDLLIAMHRRGISTFVVTNAQFPEALQSLPPVTQLYVSVDAASPETLKAIDRPLFSDYWERFIQCLKIIKHIPQRTVFRLTLVKKHNMQEAVNFGRLILLGLPDFIEIKAVTYSGVSSANKICMEDIPWHEEVVQYAESIVNSNEFLKSTYTLSSEHKHSCCVLIAHQKFFKDGIWHTWINYPKFFELAALEQPFTSLDYCLATPQWAIYGSETQGFDPLEQRIHVKGAKARELKYQPSVPIVH